MTENQPNPTTPSSIFSTTWNDASEEDVAYTRFSISALLALFAGLLSFLIFFTPWFFFLSLLGVIFAMVAVVVIRRSEGAVTGFSTACVGLSLSIISLVAVAVLWPCYQYGVRKEADRFFRIWFQELAKENIPLAKGLTALYWERRIPKETDVEKWWQEQYKEKFAHKSIHAYTDNKLIRVLLALKNEAKVTYYKTLSVVSDDGKDTVVAVYAVTYPVEGGERKGQSETFFVKMKGRREFPKGDVKSAGWTLDGLPTFHVPEEFKNQAVTPSQGAADQPAPPPMG